MPATGLFSSPRHLSDKEAEQEALERKEGGKRLNGDEMQKSVARLTVVKARLQETGPLGKSVVLGRGQLDSSVNRLYKEAVDRKKRVLDDLELKTKPTADRNILDKEVLNGSVDRIYAQAIQHKRDMEEKLRAKHIINPIKDKKLSRGDQAACNERAYASPMRKRKENEDKLKDKYITATVAKFKVMSKAEWNDTITRLSAK